MAIQQSNRNSIIGEGIVTQMMQKNVSFQCWVFCYGALAEKILSANSVESEKICNSEYIEYQQLKDFGNKNLSNKSFDGIIYNIQVCKPNYKSCVRNCNNNMVTYFRYKFTN